MKYDVLVVGAGFSGCVLAERFATLANKKVLLIDKRDHIGGNAYDRLDANGVLIHQYGPHIFHTVYPEVWQYLSRFTDWTVYYHQVLGVVEGKKVPIPFNLNTLFALFPKSLAERLEQKLLAQFGFGKKVPILDMKKTDDADLKLLAEYVYEKVFLNYTLKQWGMKPEDLSPTVTARVPVFISRDDRYFQDRYQGMPKNGYTPIFEKMLDHRNIKVMLNTEFSKVKDNIECDQLIYTGQIDTYYDYKFGKLPYRSLDFKLENLRKEYFQEVGTVNYPNEYDFTRITEYKILTGQKHANTTIAVEYPKPCLAETDIPYYPIPKDEYMDLYKKYEALAKAEKKVFFAGRLGTYSYINMDLAVLNAMKLYDRITGVHP
jgi:UDP-galactopyranose mutase